LNFGFNWIGPAFIFIFPFFSPFLSLAGLDIVSWTNCYYSPSLLFLPGLKSSILSYLIWADIIPFLLEILHQWVSSRSATERTKGLDSFYNPLHWNLSFRCCRIITCFIKIRVNISWSAPWSFFSTFSSTTLRFVLNGFSDDLDYWLKIGRRDKHRLCARNSSMGVDHESVRWFIKCIGTVWDKLVQFGIRVLTLQIDSN
jgi:hypothetical protein